MPQASDELRARMKERFGEEIDDKGPMDFLEKAHYVFTQGGLILTPREGYQPTKDEWECIDFLCDEWDYGFAHATGSEPFPKQNTQ